MKIAFVLNTAAILSLASVITSAQSAAPLRSYAVNGTENTQTYDPTTGWTPGTSAFTGQFDLVSLTEARLTKQYPDGSSVVRDLVLQWTVDLNAPTQGGMAAELPDPSDPVIKRTTYGISLTSDGVRFTMKASFQTRAYLTIAGRADWWPVAYGDLSGFVVSPLGNYSISGSEQAGKTTAVYTGTLSILSPTSGRLVRAYANGSTTTVSLAFATPVDVSAGAQSLVAAQVENQSGQSTAYAIDLTSNLTRYSASASYMTVSGKGKNLRTLVAGTFTGSQP